MVNSSAHKSGLGRWILQRGVKNGSEVCCLGTPKNKRICGCKDTLQIAPQSAGEADRLHFLARRCSYWALKNLSLRAPANDAGFDISPTATWAELGTGDYPEPVVTTGNMCRKGCLPGTVGIVFLGVATAVLSTSLLCQHNHTGKTHRSCLTGAAGLSGRRIGCPGKNMILFVNT